MTILSLFCVLSTSWCFSACLDDVSVLLSVTSQAETAPGWHNEVPTAFPPYTVVQELVSPLGVVLAPTTQQLSHGTTQAGAQLLPASTDHLLPLLLLPLSHILLQQPFRQSVLCPFHHNAPGDPERVLYPRSPCCAPGIWTSTHDSTLCTMCHYQCCKPGHTNPFTTVAVTHSDLYKNSLFIWKRLNFQLFEVHFITYCAADLACESTVLSPLLCGYRTIAQAVKWHRIWQSALAAFLMLSLSALHPWAKDTFYCYSTASTWGCLCRVEKNPFLLLTEKG